MPDQFRDLILNQVNALLGVLSPDGITLHISPNSREIVGYCPASLLGGGMLGLIHPSDRPVLMDTLARTAAAHRQDIPLRFRIATPDAGWRWLESHCGAAAGEGDHAVVIVICAHDATRTIELERQFERAHECLEEAQALAKFGSYDIDPITDAWTWSREIYRILEWPVDLPPLSMSQYRATLVHPEDRDRVVAVFQPLHTTPGTFDITYRIITPRGTLKTIQSAGRSYASSEGSGSRIVGTLRDITEDVRRLAEVRRQAQIIETIDGALVTTSIDGAISGWNRGAERVFGLSQDDALGRSVSILSDEWNAPAFWTELMKPLIESGEHRCERVLRHKNGQLLDVFLSMSLIRGAAGKPKEVVLFLMDITERKRIERQIVRYSLDLESSRDALEQNAVDMALVIAKLTDANHQAETATRAKSEFLAMMSHEIRTPLNGIIGMSGVLLSTRLDEEQRDCLETIRYSGDALLSIISDILDFSKIEAGRLELEEINFSPLQIVHESIQITSMAAKRKGISVREAANIALPAAVRGDAGRLRQVLLNLLSNAIKFTSSGEVLIKAESVTCGSKRAVLRFSVSDHGPGLTAEQQTRLFRPFSQADASTTRCFGGTGLGLAICKRLAQMLGGDIGVHSVAGSGATFWFTVDLAVVQDAEVPPPISLPVPSGKVSKNARILLVEDNTTNQKVALLMLKNIGYTADVASNGAEAIEAVASLPYDLILMDCLMPEMDGYQAARRIRKMTAYRRIPIIALTANAHAHDRKACFDAGMNDYLPKPARQEQLQLKLEYWLAQSDDSIDFPGHPNPPRISPEEDLHSVTWVSIPKSRNWWATGRAEVISELLQVFLRETRDRLERAAAACASHDWEQLRFCAHSIKGSSVSLGLTAFSDVAASLQEFAQNTQMDGAENTVCRLHEMYVEVAEFLNSKISELQGECVEVRVAGNYTI